MRFYEFADLQLDEDLETALDARENQLDNERQTIKLRKKSLANRQAKAQMRAEILATNVESASKSAMAIHRSAKSGIKADHNQRQKITKLAKSGLGRELKL